MKITGLGVHLKVSDINRSRQFYESLGFEPVFGYGSDQFRAGLPESVDSAPEKYQGVVYKTADSTTLEIADGHCGVKNQDVFNHIITDEKVSAMINVDSVVGLFENELLDIVFPVRHYYWGTIEVALRDPDGYVLVFIAPYSDAELQAVKQFTEVEEVKNER